MASVFVSTVINAPVNAVWPYLRAFNRLPEWHPFVAESHIEDGLDEAQVGCVRNFELVDGQGTIREQLLTLSDADYCLAYNILDAPMPVENYVATVQLAEITETNQTYAQWEATFEVPADQEEEVVALVHSVFSEGFASVNKLTALS